MNVRTVCYTLGFLAFASTGPVWADGTETLGAPSIPIASGTKVVANGTGMLTQPGSITVEVPLGATVKQVLLYWEGFMGTDMPGDNTIRVSKGGSSVLVTGTLIGGPTLFFSGAYASTFRADITSLGLITPGIVTLDLDQLEFPNDWQPTSNGLSNGAGVIVIIDDGTSDAQIAIRDGSDLAFINFAPPLDTTAAQTFNFTSSRVARKAYIDFFFASVSGTASGYGKRPTVIEISTGGTTTTFDNVLDSISGQEWDSFRTAVIVPARATRLTVQAFSRDDLGTGGLPASFDWLAAAFTLEPDIPSDVDGRMTGGGSVFTIDDVRVTRGFEIHCDLRAPNNLEVNWPGGNNFHMTQLISARCTDDPAIDQDPPRAPFDTFEGSGTGKLNNKAGAFIEFVFVDAGEPGTLDTASMQIYDQTGKLVLDVTGDPNVPGYLDHGNLQAHRDNK